LDYFFAYWLIILISIFFNSLWFNFIITFGDAKNNLKFKYIIYYNFILIQNLSYVKIVYGDVTISKYLDLFRRCPLGGLSSGGSALWDDFDTIFISCFMNEESSRVLSSICCNFYFLWFLALKPTCLSHFKHGIDSFANMLLFFPLRILILDRAFTARMWDLTNFFTVGENIW
jgi:hypothetical protein